MILKKGSKGIEVKSLQKLLNLYEDGIFGALTEEAVKEFQKANGLITDGIVGDFSLSKVSISTCPFESHDATHEYVVPRSIPKTLIFFTYIQLLSPLCIRNPHLKN